LWLIRISKPYPGPVNDGGPVLQNFRYRGYPQREGEGDDLGEYRELYRYGISLVMLGRVCRWESDVSPAEGIDRVKKGGGGVHAPPPSASWAENTITTGSSRESVNLPAHCTLQSVGNRI